MFPEDTFGIEASNNEKEALNFQRLLTDGKALPAIGGTSANGLSFDELDAVILGCSALSIHTGSRRFGASQAPCSIAPCSIALTCSTFEPPCGQNRPPSSSSSTSSIHQRDHTLDSPLPVLAPIPACSGPCLL